MNWPLIVCVGVLMAAGFLGTIVPVIPGLWLSWLAAVIYGIFDSFGVAGIIALLMITALAAVGTYLGLRIPQKQSAGVGLKALEQMGAVALGIVGMFVIPVVGLPIGFALGVFLARFRVTKDPKSAWSSTRTILVAMLKGSAAQAACSAAIFVCWVGWVISGV